MLCKERGEEQIKVKYVVTKRFRISEAIEKVSGVDASYLSLLLQSFLKETGQCQCVNFYPLCVTAIQGIR
jgi:hypothetical protein